MKVSEIVWLEDIEATYGDTLYLATNIPQEMGRITVLNRVTGYIGSPRDTETGYKEFNGKFWLASGLFDIRDYSDLSIEDAIELIKQNANTCRGV
jgi:hypothetical protein